MNTSIILFIIIIISLALICFIVGLLVGLAINIYHQYRVRVSQNQGEALLRRHIISSLTSQNYYLMNNITLPINDGTTQIDHILVSTKGIFVIETKNYSGWIFGDEHTRQWSQVLYKIKNKFQNPIHQNYLHIQVVRQLLEYIPKEQIHSIVVFVGNGIFKTTVPKGVVYLNKFLEYLNNFQVDAISIDHVESCVGRLECKRFNVTRKTDLQHIAYLADKFGETNE